MSKIEKINKFIPMAKLKLQLFAEGGTPPQPTPQQPMQQPMQQPTPQPQQPNISELVNGLASQINQTLDQRLGPIEQRLNQPQPMTPEQIEEQKENIRQQFENDPIGYQNSLLELAEQRITKKFEPELQKARQAVNERMWEKQVNQFKSQNPEAQKYMPQIVEVIKSNPGLMNTANPLDSAYKMAVANNLLGNGGNVVQGILGNEEYKAQLMQNPQLREMIIQDYQNGLNSGTQQAIPPMMGNQGGTSIPASTGEQPNNLKEASSSALRRLQMLQGR